MFVGQRLMFLLEKDKVLCAFWVTLLMCTSQLRVLWMFKPRYLNWRSWRCLVPVCRWYAWTVVEFLLWSVELCIWRSWRCLVPVHRWYTWTVVKFLLWSVELCVCLVGVASAIDLHISVTCLDLVVGCAGFSLTWSSGIDWLFTVYVPLKNFSLIWWRLHCRWRAANLGLCLTLRVFEQGGIFIVPHLLWHRTSNFPVSSEEPPHSVAS
jgi:hypothetical protein